MADADDVRRFDPLIRVGGIALQGPTDGPIVRQTVAVIEGVHWIRAVIDNVVRGRGRLEADIIRKLI